MNPPIDSILLDKIRLQVKETIVDEKCIKKGTFTLKSGIESNFYVNLRNLIQKPVVIRNICHLIFQKLPPLDSKQNKYIICGLPYAGIPYATALSIIYDIPLIILRKESKKYGLKNLIDGVDNLECSKVIIIDDIFTTGSSINEAVDIFTQYNLIVEKAIIILNRSTKELSAKCPVEGIFTLDELIS